MAKLKLRKIVKSALAGEKLSENILCATRSDFGLLLKQRKLIVGEVLVKDIESVLLLGSSQF